MNTLPPEDPETIRIMIQDVMNNPMARALLVKKTCGCGDIHFHGHMCHLCGLCIIGCCDCTTCTVGCGECDACKSVNAAADERIRGRKV